jgi:hypothetical protein
MLSLDPEIREDREVETASYGSDRVSDNSMHIPVANREEPFADRLQGRTEAPGSSHTPDQASRTAYFVTV